MIDTDPLWFILENVDVGDATDEQSNGAVISQVLADAGFETRMILLEAFNFALPQRRTRLFILAVNKKRATAELANSPSEILDMAVTELLPICKTAPLPVDAFLDDDTSDRVVNELQRRQQVRTSKNRRTETEETEELDLDASLKGGKWKDMHMQLAVSRGLTWPLELPTGLTENPWFATLPAREQEIIAFVQKKNDERIALNESPYRFADLYHSANRTPVSDAGVVPTVLPSGTVWDFTRSRLLTGHEQLGLQGIQMEFAHEISNNQAQDLAGNAFPATVVAALQMAMLCAMQFPSAMEDVTMDQVESLLNMIG